MTQVTFKKPVRYVNRVFLHCSDSDNPLHDNIETIRDWHIKRGFKDIGYHFFISKDGTIHKGRDLELAPASQAGHNWGTISICLHGLKKENFTERQFISLKKLCVAINISYIKVISFHGHCEVSDKECPVFDYFEVLRLCKNGFLNKKAY